MKALDAQIMHYKAKLVIEFDELIKGLKPNLTNFHEDVLTSHYNFIQQK